MNNDTMPTTDELPKDILEQPTYEPTDVFDWANRLVRLKAELEIDLFLFAKSLVPLKMNVSAELTKQLEPLFIDGILEYVLSGAETGLIVRGFEEAESEDNVLQRVRLGKVDKAAEMLNWIKSQEHELEVFSDEAHDIKRMRGIVARVSHKELKDPFYVVKALPASQVMSGKVGWMVRSNKFIPFDAEAALRIPGDDQLLVVSQDIFVFSQTKLKSLFGYDAKEASIAAQKVREIEAQFKLSFADGLSLQTLVKGRKSTIKKLQTIEPTLVTQEQLMQHAEDVGVELMEDEAGAIIIMDEKDMVSFVNLLNDDYIESPMTGLRYEIKTKKPLKPTGEQE